MKILKKVFFSLFLLVFAYIFCALFNYLPESLSPRVLFKGQYQKITHALLSDSISQSSTAKISKQVYDLLNKPAKTTPTSEQTTTMQQDAVEQDEQKPASAVDRAKAAAQDYENKINQQKEALDSL